MRVRVEVACPVDPREWGCRGAARRAVGLPLPCARWRGIQKEPGGKDPDVSSQGTACLSASLANGTVLLLRTGCTSFQTLARVRMASPHDEDCHQALAGMPASG